MSWPVSCLGDVSEFIRNGASIPQSKDAGGMPITRIESISERVFNPNKCGYAGVGDGGYLEYRLRLGDILVSHINSEKHLAKCAIFEHVGFDVIHGMNLLCLRPDQEKIVPRFLFHYLTSPDFLRLIPAITKKSVNQASFTVTAFKALAIPLPPLPEQKRIAAILDQADAIRRKRQQAIQLADDFLRAVFLDMFGDAVEGAENIVRFSDIAVLDAPMVDPRDEEFIDLMHIGPDRIEKKIGKLLPALTAREEGVISKKFLFDDRYVLYSKIRPYLRKCAMAERVGLCSADMYPVRPLEGIATREFLWMLLLSDFFTAYTESLPARANIPKLNREELEAFTLSLPDYSEQLKFSSIVRATKIASQRVVESAAYVDGAFESLSQKAFSGQL